MNDMTNKRRRVALPCLALLVPVALSGCLGLKPVSDPSRYFVLSAQPAVEAAPATNPWPHAVGLGTLTLPGYLQGNQLVTRQGQHEMQFHEWLLWGESLEKGLLRLLGVNLQRMLPTDQVYLLDWDRESTEFEVALVVNRFESDDQGLATLEASWRITRQGQEVLVGTVRQQRQGPPVQEDPDGAVAVLNGLVEELSRALAEALKQLSKPPRSAAATRWPDFQSAASPLWIPHFPGG